MKRLNAALRLACWLAMMFAIVSLSQAQSRDRRSTPTTHKEHATGTIHIVDQNGRPAMSGVPSGTGQIVDVAVGQGGFVFVPDTVNISVGDTVRGPGPATTTASLAAPLALPTDSTVPLMI